MKVILIPGKDNHLEVRIQRLTLIISDMG
jgi:hypothetical protein